MHFVCVPRCMAAGAVDSAEVSLNKLPMAAEPLEETFYEKQRMFRYKLLFRLLASCPALVGSMFKNQLGEILDYTGKRSCKPDFRALPFPLCSLHDVVPVLLVGGLVRLARLAGTIVICGCTCITQALSPF
jgi:hypothetical protein